MATNQEGVHAAIRASTGTARDYIADWHALFDAASIASGTFNERLLAWINAQLSTSYVSLPTAMQAYAIDAGFARWSDINTLSLGGGAVSLAETLAGSETDALAIVYTDDHFKATTGFNGSVYCLDSSTPVNDYDSSPTTETASYFTYTSPSPKMILHDDGVLKYAAHNLCPYSEDATNWSTNNATASSASLIVENSSTAEHGVSQSHGSTVTGATYRIYAELKAAGRNFARLGTTAGSNTYCFFNLGAGTVGTPKNVTNTAITSLGDGWYGCEFRFVATATSGTALINIANVDDNTSYAGDGSSGIQFRKVHLHTYPADTTYLKTTSAARYADPIEFNSSGTSLGLLVEPQRTNLATYSSDLTNAAWTKSNMTTAKTATGPGSVANQATTCTATAGNATALQAITSTSAQRVTSVWLKRRTGTGNIDLTQDNGSTWTTVAVDSDWTSFAIAAVTSANPTVGLRIVTSGDAVDVAFFQHELGPSATSPIETYGSTATRAADNISKATSGFPYSGSAGTIYVEGKTPKALVGDPILAELSADSNNRMDLFSYTAGATYWFGRNGSGTQWGMALDAVAADTLTQLAGAYASNDFQGCSDGNLGSADTSGAVPTCTVLYVGNGRGGSQGGNHIKAILYLPRRVSNVDMQTLTSTGALP